VELPSTTPRTPAGVVAGARAELHCLGEVLWAAKTPGELVGTVEELEALRAQLAALEASVLVEVEARKVARTHLSWGSTSDWFTHLAGTHRGPGHRAVRQASVLVTELPRTHAALASGTVSPEQAGVIVDAVDQLPHRDDLREQGEEFLLDAATRLNATELAKAAKHLLEVADPDKTERDAEKAAEREARAAHLGRFLAITEDGAGGVRVRGRGSVEDAAKLRAALLPLTAPAPGGSPKSRGDSSSPPATVAR
jgi:hypothetical protein